MSLQLTINTEETIITYDDTKSQPSTYPILSNANPARGHKGVGRSTGHIMVTSR